MEYKETDIDELILNKKNPRINDAAAKKLIKGIEKYGFVNPVIVNQKTNIVLAGHTRIKAMKKLGRTTVPVVYVDMDEATAKGFAIWDNKSAEFSSWDDELLAAEIKELKAMDFDIALTGFDEKGGLIPDDEVPETPEEPVTKLGDLWLLGEHRVLCGDSTDKKKVEVLLNKVKPLLMVTDPPYGVNYDPSWRDKVVNKNGITGTTTRKIRNDDMADWREAWSLFPGDIAYVWHAGIYAGIVLDSLIACDFNIRQQIIWAKDRLVLSRGNYHWQHEPCWYAVRKKGKAYWEGGRKKTTLWRNIQDVLRNNELLFIRYDDITENLYVVSGDESTVWEIPKQQKSETGHSTQKPVECMERPIRNHKTKEVYDPFLGSGSTLIAAEKTNRKCYGMEIDPHYTQVILQRWSDYTGKDPVREDGVKFSELKKAEA